MFLSSQTFQVQRRFGYEKAIALFAEAGFDAFDFSQFMPQRGEDLLYGEQFREYARHLRFIADAVGIVCNQSHAPFPCSEGDPERDAVIFDRLIRSMEIASILGAKCIVVHPKHHLPYRTNKALLKEMNLQFYRSLLPYCEQFGIKVAVENMWQNSPVGRQIVDSTCSDAEEFCEYVDMLDSPWIVACLDIGHTALVGEDFGRMIRTLGQKRLQALHVHDVDGISDLHTLPFMSKIDFKEVTALLKEIGYQGDLTFEADTFLTRLPLDLYLPALRFMAATGRQLIRMIEEA